MGRDLVSRVSISTYWWCGVVVVYDGKCLYTSVLVRDLGAGSTRFIWQICLLWTCGVIGARPFNGLALGSASEAVVQVALTLTTCGCFN